MKRVIARQWTVVSVTSLALVVISRASSGASPKDAPAPNRLRLDTRHPWRPPFRLERVGQPIAVVVETSARPGPAIYIVEALSKGKKVAKEELHFPEKSPYSARATLDGAVTADELVLFATAGEAAKPVELARQTIYLPEFEADAIARPDKIVNPVDLGTILVPSGWLLLGPGQSATLEIAAISHTRDLPKASPTRKMNTS